MKNVVGKLQVNSDYFNNHKAVPFTLTKNSLNTEIISWNTKDIYYPSNMQDANIRLSYLMNNAKQAGLDDMAMPDQPSKEKTQEKTHEITFEEFSSYYDSDMVKKQGSIWNIDKLYTSIFITKETNDKIKEKYNRNVSLVCPAADCAVVRYYDKEKQIIGITHSDAVHTGNNIIKDMTEYMKNHFKSNLEDIEVYVGAFAYDDWIYDGEPKFMYEKDKEGNVIGLNKEWKNYIESIGNNKYKIHYGDKIFDQINQSGIPKENIYFSDDNTLFNRNYFSNSRSKNEGERQGRNLFGITFASDEIIENKEKSGIKLQ